MRRRTALALFLGSPLLLVPRLGRALPSSNASAVTVYGASWCGPCHTLQRALAERDIPFDFIDIDKSPESHERAKQATGTSAIPVTSVVRGSDITWIVGADIAAVERAYRG